MRLGYTFGPFDWPSSNSYAFLRFSLLTILYIATSSSPSTGFTLNRPVRVPKPASLHEDYNTTNNNITYYSILLLPVRNIPAGGVACNILCARRRVGHVVVNASFEWNVYCLRFTELLLIITGRSATVLYKLLLFYTSQCVCARVRMFIQWYISANFHQPLLRNHHRPNR